MAKKTNYQVMKELAQETFDNYHFGLYIALEKDPKFKKIMERPYRVNAFSENHNFYMTANEKYFHLIGFMDAIVMLERLNLISWNNDDDLDDECEISDEDILEPLKPDENSPQSERSAISWVINYSETGED